MDHVFAGVLPRGARSKPEELAYLPLAGGAEVVQNMLTRMAVAGMSGHSEISEQLAHGKLLAIWVSSKHAASGIASIRDHGIEVEMANRRGVFTDDGVTAARRGGMVEAVKLATAHESWSKTLKQNHWESSVLVGPSFNSFIETDLTTARMMVHLLKMKA